MTNDIGTSTSNITVNDHTDVRETLKEVEQEQGWESMGSLLRRIIELGLMAIHLKAADKVRRIHCDYYGGDFWEAEVKLA